MFKQEKKPYVGMFTHHGDLSDVRPCTAMITKAHILEFVRQMEKRTGDGVSSYDICKYFRLTHMGFPVRQLKNDGWLRVKRFETAKCGGRKKILELSPKAINFLVAKRIISYGFGGRPVDIDHRGFLSEKNSILQEFLNRLGDRPKNRRSHPLGTFLRKLPYSLPAN